MKKIFSIIGLKPLDILFLLVSIGAIIFSVTVLNKNSQAASYIYISSPKSEYIYPLDKDNVYAIQGKTGITTIEVSGGKAQITDSPCPNKTCTHDIISSKGQWAACLPNGIFLRIDGNTDGDSFDAISQ